MLLLLARKFGANLADVNAKRKKASHLRSIEAKQVKFWSTFLIKRSHLHSRQSQIYWSLKKTTSAAQIWLMTTVWKIFNIKIKKYNGRFIKHRFGHDGVMTQARVVHFQKVKKGGLYYVVVWSKSGGAPIPWQSVDMALSVRIHTRRLSNQFALGLIQQRHSKLQNYWWNYIEEAIVDKLKNNLLLFR